VTDRFYRRSAVFCAVVNALFGAWPYGNAIVLGERIA
jgi:hypothetical protein